jgi:lipopolysaccharide/colanic/teichoic acid biosynthesis glycosyltransferase
MGRPVFFWQLRPGFKGRPFVLVKIRSMVEIDAGRGRVSDKVRLTRLGRLLRATSLDELPTLWNVLRGDMSLVGPRPLLMQYLPLYTVDQYKRHDVRPGITGLAQVSGRNELSWEEKFVLDVAYVDNASWALDARILLATARGLVRPRGVAAVGHSTMPPFTGEMPQAHDE